MNGSIVSLLLIVIISSYLGLIDIKVTSTVGSIACEMIHFRTCLLLEQGWDSLDMVPAYQGNWWDLSFQIWFLPFNMLVHFSISRSSLSDYSNRCWSKINFLIYILLHFLMFLAWPSLAFFCLVITYLFVCIWQLLDRC
jgi:hypothetical protein